MESKNYDPCEVLEGSKFCPKFCERCNAKSKCFTAKVLLELWATESASMLLAKVSRPCATMPDAKSVAFFVAVKVSRNGKHQVKCLLAEKRDCVRSFGFQK